MKEQEEHFSKDKKIGEEKVRLGEEILERVKIFTEDEWYMKTLTIVNDPTDTRNIYKTPVKSRDDFLPHIRKTIHDIRPVTQVFCCNVNKELFYYQYWTPTQWAEGISCFYSKENVSEKIPLKTPEDFKQIPYDGVQSFHKSLQGKNVIDKLIEENRSYNPKSYFKDNLLKTKIIEQKCSERLKLEKLFMPNSVSFSPPLKHLKVL